MSGKSSFIDGPCDQRYSNILYSITQYFTGEDGLKGIEFPSLDPRYSSWSLDFILAVLRFNCERKYLSLEHSDANGDKLPVDDKFTTDGRPSKFLISVSVASCICCC